MVCRFTYNFLTYLQARKCAKTSIAMKQARKEAVHWLFDCRIQSSLLDHVMFMSCCALQIPYLQRKRNLLNSDESLIE